jgi:hypothetical protein
MKNALKTWIWSLGVVARSPLTVGALALVLAAALYAGYRWLYFPMESAVSLFLLGLVWALLAMTVMVGLVAASTGAALEIAASGARAIPLRGLLRFNGRHWRRIAGFMLLAIPVVLAVYSIFEWINNYSLEVASWLTFNAEKPVAPETVERFLGWVEYVLWTVMAGFQGGFLLTLIRDGWRRALRSSPGLLANACWRATFLTTLVSILVFVGIAQLLVNWNPTAPPGYLDWAQVIVRCGLALSLIVAGWIVWILAMARQSDHAEASPAPSPATE